MKPDFDGKRFSFPGENLLASPTDVLRWAITRKPVKWPRHLDNPPADPVIDRVNGPDLRITFINHATALIQGCGINIITDPVFSKRVSPVSFAGPKRHRAAGLSIDALPPIDVVLISHTHYDHLDLRSLKKLKERDTPSIIAPCNTSAIIKKSTGMAAIELSWWDQHTLSEQVTATLVPSRHWTSRRLGDHNTSLWGGFVITLPGGSVYFAGDTGYGNGEHFHEARKRLGPFRCALLPIGAYEPRWFMKSQHMNPAEAVQAYKDLGASHAIGIHHGTFQLTDEAHDAPKEDLAASLTEHGLSEQQFRALENGSAWDIPPMTR